MTPDDHPPAGALALAAVALTAAAVLLGLLLVMSDEATPVAAACDSGYVQDGIVAVRLLDAERLNAEWRAKQRDNRSDGDPAWTQSAEEYQRALEFTTAALARCAGGLQQ